MTPSSQNTKGRRERPVVFETSPSELHVTLVVDVERFESTYVSFNTRTYNGSIPAPTIKVCPGDRLVFHIYNQLDEGHENRTNVHVHGMHVSPEENHDNVLINIQPGKDRVYDYRIRQDHPPGTFWYHPHSRGIVNSQISGMMAGTLLVVDRPGNFPKELAKMDDLVMILQGICAEDCENEHDSIVNALRNEYTEVKREEMDAGFDVDLDIHGVSPLNDTSLLHVYVNGQYSPTLPMKVGEWKRLRWLNALANNVVELVAPSCEMHLLGRDGVYRDGEPKFRDVVILPPGGRADVALRCTTAGTFFVGSESNPSRNTLLGKVNSHRAPTQKIVHLLVEDDTSKEFEGWELPIKLPQLAPYMESRANYPSELVKAQNKYNYEFSIWFDESSSMKGKSGMSGMPGMAGMQYGVNRKRMSPHYVNHSMIIDELQEWQLSVRMYGKNCQGSQTLRTDSMTSCHKMNHPFHIHSTHFQIIKKTKGFDPDDLLYEIGEWRDTVPLYNSELTIRFTPRSHMVGNVLTHCHVSAHADQGMGQMVQVRES
ncbi:unnamed protein product [Albugo candida]|nr:unnamed protein product [Albugo candida]|eukprot:CCI43333.1 unnamed protein product [Albugo candida]